MPHRRRTTHRPWLTLLGIGALVALIAWLLAEWGGPESGFETLPEPPRPGPSTAESPQRHGARAKPPVDAEAAPSVPLPTSDRETLLVTVTNKDGIPLTEVPVTLVAEDLHTETRPTDEGGRVRFHHPGQGWVMAKAPSTFAVTAAVKPRQLEYTLTVRDSPCSVEGRLFIDGQPAEAGKKLLIKMPLSRWSAIPWWTNVKLSKGESPDSFFAVTDADGRFSVRGLELGDGFFITLPPGLVIARGFPYAGAETSHVSGLCKAKTSIEVHAIRAPLLGGRCLDASGAPLPDVEITVFGIVSGRRRRIAPPLTSNGEGRFRVAMDFPSWLPVTLEARWAGVTLCSEPLETAWTEEKNLPPFIFPVAALLELQIRDATGHPVPSAKVGIRGQDKLVVDVDAQGKAVLQLPPRHPVHVQVAAWGFQFVERLVEVSNVRQQLIITMQRSNTVCIRLEDRAGRGIRNRSVSIVGQNHILRIGSAARSPVFLATLRPTTYSSRRGRAWLSGRTDKNGEIHAYDIAQDVPMTARLSGLDDMTVAENGPKRLGNQRHGLFRIVLPEEGENVIHGVVTGPAGESLFSARVHIGCSTGRGGVATRTDVNGRFLFSNSVFDAAYLTASKPGYIPERVFLEGLLTRKEPIRFILRRALECEIEVRQADGNLAPEATIHFPYRRDGGPALVERRGDGTFHVRNLSDKPITFRVAHGYSPTLEAQLHPANEAVKVIRLPAEGHLSVRWDHDPESREFVIYWAETERRGFPLSAMWTKDSAETNLPAGRYRVGRAQRKGNGFEFTEQPHLVDLHAGEHIELTID